MSVAHETHRHGGTVAVAPGVDVDSTPRPGSLLPPPAGPAAPGPTSPRPWHRRRMLAIVIAVLVVGAAAAVFVMFPRSQPEFVVDSMRFPDTIVLGETLDVEVDVRNTGSGSGEHEFTLLVDGQSAATSTVELDADASATLELTVTGLQAGAHELAIEGFDDVRGSLEVLAPEFVVDSMRFPDTIVVGETLDVEVDVRNTGRGSGEHEFTLLVDGQSAATSTVELDADSAATVGLTVDGLEAGPHEVAIEGFDDVRGSLRVLTPAAFVIDELAVSPQQVDLAVAPVVTVTARYSNIGEAAGSHVLQLTVDGRPVEQREVSLDGGESGEATFTLTMDRPGHPVIGVDDATAEVWVLTPAELAIDSVTVTPNPANLTKGNVVTVSAAVSNIGETDGTFTLELSHDGSVVETRDVTLAGSQSIEQLFTVTLTHPGRQVLSVNGVEAELEVYQIERPDDGAVLLNALGGGPNLLTVANQRDEDVYVVLTAAGEEQPPLLGVYVHAGSTQTVSGIPGGTYSAFFAHGKRWCTYYQRFTKNPDYGRFDEDASFESTSTSYTEITLTFGATEGWSPTSSVDPTDFPR